MTFKRIVWDKILLLSSLLMFIGVEGWLIFSLTQAKKTDSLLLSMVIIVGAIVVFLLVINIILFIMKNDAISLEYPFVIIKTFNEKRIAYRDIKDIRYISDSSGSGPKGGVNLGLYKSGTIVFYLNDGKKIKVKGIKEVKNACMQIRKEILR